MPNNRRPYRALDIAGQRFGRLTAVRRTDTVEHSYIWECRCDCGKICYVPVSQLRSGISRSCGCLQDENRRRDITGQRRGHLTAIRPTDERRNGITVWEWRCDCGATVYKAITLVGDSASTMCRECARRLKRSQAALGNAMRDPVTGMMPGAIDGIRSGKLFRNNSSGVRGVNWHAGTRKWTARISVNGISKTIGYFDTIDEAAKARREAVAQKYGAEPEK